MKNKPLNLMLAFCFASSLGLNAQPVKTATGEPFDNYFLKKTLRVDYELGGNAKSTFVFFKQMKEEPNWGGPNQNFIDPFDYGNFRYRIFDAETNKLIYLKGFSTLYEEWKATEEAKNLYRTFYQVATLPFPKKSIRFEIDQRDYATGRFETIFSRQIDPNDYFIQKEAIQTCKTTKIFGKGDPSKSLDIAVIAEGYTAKDMKKFVQDAKRVLGNIIDHEPYKKYADRINVYAIEAISQQQGPDVPGEHIYNNTAIGTSYYTFNVDRYLTSSDYKTMCDYAANVPYDQIFVLINSPRYGGGGFYNYYTACTADHKLTPKVSLHEFGHGFGGLADEYYNSEVATSDFYNLKTEPWEPNITTNVEFDSKWADMIKPETPIPTPRTTEHDGTVGMFEGGGYVSKGIFSPVSDCNMKSNNPTDYCPVCQRAVEARLKYYFDEKVNLPGTLKITAPPQSLGFDPFYKKYLDAKGISIIGSHKVPDEAFFHVRRTILQMLSKRPDVLAKMVENKARIGIMARYEGTTEIPEHRELAQDTSINWDLRARGLGADIETPITTCAEENLLGYELDKYHNEDILIHEFAHSMHGLAIMYIDTSFNSTLQKYLDMAMAEGKWLNTYAATNIWEYFAEGVQDWFNVNGEAIPGNGVHIWVNTRKELKEYDPRLYELLSKWLPDEYGDISRHVHEN
ncbi:MAG: M64 family metallopeptidase [Bacteroidales bacterium]